MDAVYAGRDAVGVEYEPRWAHLARANLAHAVDLGATGHGRVVVGDARNIPVLLGGGMDRAVASRPERESLAWRVALLLTSPPYGSMVHGQVRPSRDSGQPGVQKWDHRYSRDRSNLAHRCLPELVDGFCLASFFQMTEVRKARAKGTPIHLVAHEDLLVLRRPLREDEDAP